MAGGLPPGKRIRAAPRMALCYGPWMRVPMSVCRGNRLARIRQDRRRRYRDDSGEVSFEDLLMADGAGTQADERKRRC